MMKILAKIISVILMSLGSLFVTPILIFGICAITLFVLGLNLLLIGFNLWSK